MCSRDARVSNVSEETLKKGFQSRSLKLESGEKMCCRQFFLCTHDIGFKKVRNPKNEEFGTCSFNVNLILGITNSYQLIDSKFFKCLFLKTVRFIALIKKRSK